MTAKLARLWRSRRGATMPLIAFGLMPMMAALGGSVDIGRIYITRSQMQAGVNAAALAAANAQDNASETDENGRYLQAVRYFQDNVRNGYMGVTTPEGVTPYGGTTTLLRPAFSLSSSGISRTDVTATGNIPLTFMSIFGMRTYRITVTAHAEFQPHPLEVMVVLDNTGSMNDQIDGVSKMASLKTAMHSFLNVLYQGAASQPDLAIGIINYTITTNVGSILQAYSIPTQNMEGFTDRTWAGTAPDSLGWKGCVSDDETVNTMSTSMTVSEADAYDIWPALPGEKPKPSSPRVMAPIKPYFYPPIFYPKSQATTGANIVDRTNPGSDYYASTTTSTAATPGGDFNLFRPTSGVSATTLYNLPIYKRYIFRMYKALNNGSANMADDVIVGADGTSYYDTTAAGAYNDLTNTGTDFYVRADKIPFYSNPPSSTVYWRDVVHYDINKVNVNQPSPNYQCPEPGLPITYGVPKTTFDNYVDTKVWPVKPANGTMHHIGFLWGWRLLTRYDVFTRTKPAGSGTPRRALVFMTDGLSALTIDSNNKDRVFTAYGAPAELQIATTANGFLDAVKLRFTKACSIANALNLPDSGKPPMIFTVAINRGSDIDSDAATRLQNCGTSGYWLTTSPAALNAAFQQIARTLTDVHLVQ
ncbi:TadE/TadG family type IV pilus assembly protein [Sphingomonas natans]|uniref:TadE/TadG family type IV pilus assembly protein n=1 Tax=Sphingomonas natans TaxID=3063330 RepID=UPI0026E12BA1|nr:pilus assembly protein TadG-related protein [Sphingomonas sp. BIUV-7]